MQILQTNNTIRVFHVGNSRSLGTPVDNRFIHHHIHHPGAQKEEVEVEEVTEEEEEAEMEGVSYLLRQDQACSHRTDKLLTLNSWAASPKHSQETGQKLSPSSHNGSCTVGSTPTMR
jgi:hypothetical protein